MINIGIKKKIGDIEITVETTVENEESAKEGLKNLYELIKNSQKESFPGLEKPGILSNKLSYMKG